MNFASNIRHCLITSPTAAWLWLVHIAVVSGALYFMPGAPFVSTLTTLALLPILTIRVYRHTSGHSSKGEVVLCLAATLLSLGLIANVYSFTTSAGGTDASPILHNSDALRNWNDALYYLGVNADRSPLTHGMYGAIVSIVMRLTGISVTAALMISVAATMVTLLCTSTLAVNITARRGDGWRAMALTAAICYLMASGVILVKDAWVIAAVALAAVALSRFELSWRTMLLMIVSSAMLALSRPNMLPAILLGVMIMLPVRRHDRTRLTAAAIAATIIIIAWTIPTALALSPDASRVIAGHEALGIKFDHAQQAPYYALVGDYMQLPLWQRVLLMPFSATVQFFIPFPWNFLRDTTYGLSQIYAHVSYLWYAFGGVIIYYLLFARRGSGKPLRLLTLWGVLIWLVPCWCFGGTISRYALPAIPLLAPAVLYTLSSHRATRKFKIFCLTFATLVIATLLICYHLQNHTAL